MRADCWCWQLFAVLVVIACGQSASDCPGLCTCRDGDREVECDRAGLDTVPQVLHVQLRRFVAPGNEITTLDQLYAYPLLEVLDLSRNQISRVEGKPFEAQRSLVTLNLSHNRISVIGKDAFTGLTRSLHLLDLSGNKLGVLDPRVFGKLETLRKLVLSANELTGLGRLAYDLPRLGTLDLSGNRISGVKEIWEGGASWGLRELKLSGNPLALSGKDFEFLPRLEKLDLSLCHLSVLEQSSFAGLTHLKELNLSRNKFVEVPTHTFSPLMGLEVLNLSYTTIKAVHSSAFGNLSKLKVLDISGSSFLDKWMSGALTGLANLETLDLSHCRNLLALGKDSLAFAPKLQRVTLAFSGLASITANSFGDGGSAFALRLSTFNLTSCPLSCDCDLAWLRNPAFRHSGAVCHSPRRVQGLSTIEVVNDDAFQCQHSGSTSLMVILVLAGAGTIFAVAAIIAVGVVVRRRHEKKQCGTEAAPDILQNVPFLANYHPPTEQIVYDLRHDYPFVTDIPSGITGYKLEPVTDL